METKVKMNKHRICKLEDCNKEISKNKRSDAKYCSAIHRAKANNQKLVKQRKEISLEIAKMTKAYNILVEYRDISNGNPIKIRPLELKGLDVNICCRLSRLKTTGELFYTLGSTAFMISKTEDDFFITINEYNEMSFELWDAYKRSEFMNFVSENQRTENKINSDKIQGAPVRDNAAEKPYGRPRKIKPPPGLS